MLQSVSVPSARGTICRLSCFDENCILFERRHSVQILEIAASKHREMNLPWDASPKNFILTRIFHILHQNMENWISYILIYFRKCIHPRAWTSTVLFSASTLLTVENGRVKVLNNMRSRRACILICRDRGWSWNKKRRSRASTRVGLWLYNICRRELFYNPQRQY